jgi:outer membrane protein TolC
VGVNVSWSFFDGGRTTADVAQADAAVRAARARLEEFDTQLPVEVRQRRLEAEAAVAKIAAADDEVRSATEARRVSVERYAAGVITNFEVLDAQVALLQAGLDRTRARADLRLSLARLDRALGR